MDEVGAERLSRAVSHWLEFQVLCGRSALLSEAYLTQPVGEFLLMDQSGTVDAEVAHPVLNRPRRGRPRQVDYVIRSRDTARLTAAVEAKWVDSNTIEKQRIVDDLLRLECVREPGGQHVFRYFLVSGTVGTGGALQASRIRGEVVPFINPLLSFDMNVAHSVDVQTCGASWRRYFGSFAVTYGVHLPTSFTTTLVGVLVGGTAWTRVWRVQSDAPRPTFDATAWAPADPDADDPPDDPAPPAA